MGSSQSGAQSIRYNRNLVSKRNSFKEINNLIINEKNNTKIKGLSQSENRKIRIALDKKRLISESAKKLAYIITAFIGVALISLMIKAIEMTLF